MICPNTRAVQLGRFDLRNVRVLFANDIYHAGLLMPELDAVNDTPKVVAEPEEANTVKRVQNLLSGQVGAIVTVI
jgi:hypothetical protein